MDEILIYASPPSGPNTAVDQLGFVDDAGVFSATPVITPLPSPAALFATGIGTIGLLGWRRKRKNLAAAA
jgi:hypothetical protein